MLGSNGAKLASLLEGQKLEARSVPEEPKYPRIGIYRDIWGI